jgi:hypothetical protein
LCVKKLFKRKVKLPETFIIPNNYDLPIHDQKDKNNCTSHSIAEMFEYKLSEYFKEQTLIDVDDLWEKQLKYGTATQDGDTMEDAMKTADEYGMLFTTKSGKKGIFRPTKGIEMIDNN